MGFYLGLLWLEAEPAASAVSCSRRGGGGEGHRGRPFFRRPARAGRRSGSMRQQALQVARASSVDPSPPRRWPVCRRWKNSSSFKRGRRRRKETAGGLFQGAGRCSGSRRRGSSRAGPGRRGSHVGKSLLERNPEAFSLLPLAPAPPGHVYTSTSVSRHRVGRGCPSVGCGGARGRCGVPLLGSLQAGPGRRPSPPQRPRAIALSGRNAKVGVLVTQPEPAGEIGPHLREANGGAQFGGGQNER